MRKTGIVLGVAVAALSALLIVYGMYVFARAFSGATDTVKVAVLGAIVSIMTIVVSRYMEQRRSRQDLISQERIKIYRRFLEFFFVAFANKAVSESLGKNFTEEEKNRWMLREIYEFQRDMIFWSPDATIKSWLDLRHALSNSRVLDDAAEVGQFQEGEFLALAMEKMSALLIKMRQDIGYGFTSLSAADIAQMMLDQSDPENQKVMALLRRER